MSIAGEAADPTFDLIKDSWRERGPDGRVRSLRHVDVPFSSSKDETVGMLVGRYLDAVGPVYGMPASQVDILKQRLADPNAQGAPGYSYRWAEAPRIVPLNTDRTPEVGQARLLTAEQTMVLDTTDGAELALVGAGMRIIVRQQRRDDGSEELAVTSSSLNSVWPAPPPGFTERSAAFIARLATDADRRNMAQALLNPAPDVGARIARRSVTGTTAGRAALLPAGDVRSAPALVGEIACVMESGGTDGPLPRERIGYHLTVDEGPDGAIRLLSVQALAADCALPVPHGTIFDRDPISGEGDLDLTPMRETTVLDNYTTSVPLEDLTPGTTDVGLAGTWVALAGSHGDPNPLRIAPPRKPFGEDFDFTVRSDGFAAVSAYCHCNTTLRLANAFGCQQGTYFYQPANGADQPQFPLPVAHRAPLILFDPPLASPSHMDRAAYTLGAQVLQDAGLDSSGQDLAFRIREIRFALADLSDGKTSPLNYKPVSQVGALGAAADPRIAWHEFGHAILVAATGALRLPFAHSVGDALAAILTDWDSELARPAFNNASLDMRGVTFPWITEPLRRHDRRPDQGWAWNGSITTPDPAAYPPWHDRDGYKAEQILSSTLFRLYRAIGGDAADIKDAEPDPARRARAAYYVAYLIIKAVGLLGPARTTPSTPDIFATALMEVDAATTLFQYAHAGEDRRGGALAKIVRWVFELQGLYWPAAAIGPWNARGNPPPVDIYLEDGRAGEYEFTDDWQARPGVISIMVNGNQVNAPVPGARNDVFLRIHNRGTDASQDVRAGIWVAAGADADTWRNDATVWIPLPAPADGVTAIPPGGEAIIGPFAWQLAANAKGRYALLAAVDTAGDRAVIFPPFSLPCAEGPTAVGDVVPYDNNLGYRIWEL